MNQGHDALHAAYIALKRAERELPEDSMDRTAVAGALAFLEMMQKALLTAQEGRIVRPNDWETVTISLPPNIAQGIRTWSATHMPHLDRMDLMTAAVIGNTLTRFGLLDP